MEKPAFDLRKVIDPSHHMPIEVQEAHHEIMVRWDKGNDSFHFWSVGSCDYDEEEDPDYYILDKWTRENFEKGEELIILNWW